MNDVVERFNPCNTEVCKERCDNFGVCCEEICIDEIESLRQQIVTAFDLDEVPQFRQGVPTHELEEVVTAERCAWFVGELITLRQRVEELERDVEYWRDIVRKEIVDDYEKELAALKQSQGEPVAWGLQVSGEEPYLRQIWVIKDGPFNQAKERWPEAYKNAYQVPLYTSAPTIPEGWQLVTTERMKELEEYEFMYKSVSK